MYAKYDTVQEAALSALRRVLSMGLVVTEFIGRLHLMLKKNLTGNISTQGS